MAPLPYPGTSPLGAFFGGRTGKPNYLFATDTLHRMRHSITGSRTTYLGRTDMLQKLVRPYMMAQSVAMIL